MSDQNEPVSKLGQPDFQMKRCISLALISAVLWVLRGVCCERTLWPKDCRQWLCGRCKWNSEVIWVPRSLTKLFSNASSGFGRNFDQTLKKKFSYSPCQDWEHTTNHKEKGQLSTSSKKSYFQVKLIHCIFFLFGLWPFVTFKQLSTELLFAAKIK